MSVPAEHVEAARATFIALFPTGFEEREGELVAYTDGEGEARLRTTFAGAVRAEDVEPGWEDRWREFHRPVRVGVFWLGPPWERPPRAVVPVVIDPGRAFGTGAHPSTRLCVGALEELERGSLLDVGCGSGAVAVAAAMLGFAPVTAIDIDPAAVEATVRNAAVNGVHVAARVEDAFAEPLDPADAVVANIALAAAERLAPLLDCGRLVTAGYLERDRPVLSGFAHDRRTTLDGWAADTWSRVGRG